MANELQQEIKRLLNGLFAQDDVVNYFALMNPDDEDAPAPSGGMTREQQLAHKKFKAAVASLLLEIDYWDRDEAFKDMFNRLLDKNITQRMNN